MELFLGIIVLILVLAVTRRYHAWRIKRAYIFIIDDLKDKGAYSIDSAVDLPYAKRNLLKMGTRQHHPQAVDHLIMENIVGRTEDGRFILLSKMSAYKPTICYQRVSESRNSCFKSPGLVGRGDNLVTRCWGKVPSTSLSTSSGP